MKPKFSTTSKELSHDMDLVLPPGCKKDKKGVEGDDNQNSDNLESEELRLVLIGKTGSGKSASGNTILGQSHFLSQSSAGSVTKTCQHGSAELTEEAQRDGGVVTQRRMRRVVVVDTPGFGDTDLSEEEVHAEVAKCVSLSAPGPHAFLLVVPIEWYTDDQDKAVCEFTKIFRDETIWLHTLVLFTRGDDLDGTTIEDFLQKAPPKLQALVDRCGGRYHVFNNRDPSNSVQVKELINKVEKMAKQTNKGFYTNPIFSEAEAAIREEQKNILRKRGQARRKEQGGNNSNSREGQAQPNGQQNSGSSNSSSRGSSWFSSWVEAALSPKVLNRIKIMVTAVAAGAAVGLVLGAAAPLAAAAGASLSGTSVSYAASLLAGNAIAGATGPAVGAVVTAASGNVAVAVGAAVGAGMGGIVGGNAGIEADSPQDGAMDAVKQVGVLGVSAVAVAGVFGGVVGGMVARKAALSAASGLAADTANAAAVGGAASAAAVGSAASAAAVGGAAIAAALGKAVETGIKSVAGVILAGGMEVTVQKEKTRHGTGTEASYTEKTSCKIQLNKSQP